MSLAREYRNETSMQAVDFWDRLRAAANTPDVPTFQQPGIGGGFFGLAKKVGAQLAMTPSNLFDLGKAVVKATPTIGAAMQPQGALERLQLGQAITGGLEGIARTAIENPVSTIGTTLATPAGAYGLGRELTYATLGEHAPAAMMWLRSMLPWYEGKPWTRVPGGVEKVVQDPSFTVRLGFHDERAQFNVANRLQPYLESRGEAPLQNMSPDEYIDAMSRHAAELYHASDAGNLPPTPKAFRADYVVPHGLEEVVGGAFVKQTPGRTRILDDLRWYLDPSNASENARIPLGDSDLGGMGLSVPTGTQMKDFLAAARKNPKYARQIFASLLKPGGMIGTLANGAAPGIGPVTRVELRNMLEAIAKKHGVSYPIDWNIDVPPTTAPPAATQSPIQRWLAGRY